METLDLLRARRSSPWSRVKLLDDDKMSYSVEGKPSLDIGRMTLEYCLTSPVIDREGDLILPDAPDWSDHKRNPLTLFNHKLDQPFGKSEDTAGRYTVERRGDRWYGKSYLFQNDPFAEEVYRLAEKGALNGASIGFLPAKPPFGASTVKHMNGYDYTVIESCKVFEWSAVYIPMNQDALLVAAEVVRKGLGNKPLSERAMAMFSPFVPEPMVWANGWTPAVKAAGWNESDHPRDNDGKFGSGGGSSDSSKEETKKEPKESKEDHKEGQQDKEIKVTENLPGRVKHALNEIKDKLNEPTYESLAMALNKVEEAGFKIPGFDIKRDLQTFKDRYGKRWSNIPAAVMEQGGQKTLLINNAYFTLNDHIKKIEESGKSGMSSTGNRDHVFIHEIGHILHRVYAKDDENHDLYGEDKNIANKVSKRAAEDANEFVSEVFAGIVGGKTYSDDVMDLYKKFNGPEFKAKKSFAPTPRSNPFAHKFSGILKMYDDQTTTEQPVDPVAANVEGDAPSTPLGAQFIAGVHEIAMTAAKFYTDNVTQLEPELVGEFTKLEKIIMGAVASMAQMFNGRYQDLPPLDGADWIDPDGDGDIDVTDDPELNPDAEEDKAMAEDAIGEESAEEEVGEVEADGEEVDAKVDDEAEVEVESEEDDEEDKPRFKKSFVRGVRKSLKVLLDEWMAKQKAIKEAAKKIDHPDAILAVKAASQFLRTIAGDPREDKAMRGRAKKLRADLVATLPKVKAKLSVVVPVAPETVDIDIEKIASHFNATTKALEIDSAAIQEKLAKLFQLTGK